MLKERQGCLWRVVYIMKKDVLHSTKIEASKMYDTGSKIYTCTKPPITNNIMSVTAISRNAYRPVRLSCTHCTSKAPTYHA